MEYLAALGLAAVSGVIAAVATAFFTMRTAAEDRKADREKWRAEFEAAERRIQEDRQRDDRLRFIDLKRQRYAEFLRVAQQHRREFVIQRAAARELANGGLVTSIPPVGSTDEIGALAEEILLLARAVGVPAINAYMALLGMDSFVDRPFRHQDDDGVSAFDRTYGEHLGEFIQAARIDLGVSSEDTAPHHALVTAEQDGTS